MTRASFAELGKGVLSGVLSVTTAALLMPWGSARAMGVRGEAESGSMENHEARRNANESGRAVGAANWHAGISADDAIGAPQVNAGKDVGGGDSSGSPQDGADHARPQVDEVPGEDPDDVYEEDSSGSSLEFAEPVLLAGCELVSGTYESPTCYASGELFLNLHVQGGFDGLVSLVADGREQYLEVRSREELEDSYEVYGELDDGLYESLAILARDGQGASCEVDFEYVSVDSRPPVYRAGIEDGVLPKEHDGVIFVATPCTLEVVVEEQSPDEALRLVCNGESVESTRNGSLISYELDLTADGSYRIGLEGADSFGREPVWSGLGLELPVCVVVDTQAPLVRVRYDGRELGEEELCGGTLYVRRRPHIVIEVADEYADVNTFLLGGGATDGWCLIDDVYRLEVGEDINLDRPLYIAAADLAGNRTDDKCVVPVVEDVDAPTIEAERLEPDVVVREGDHTSLFFANKVFVRLLVDDEHRIARIDVDAGDACDVIRDGFEPGDSSAVLTLALEEGKEFTREVQVKATDLAGNWRTWSLDAHGKAFESGVEEATDNAPVYYDASEHPVFPVALLLDCTAPVVEVLGIEDGGVYGASREAVVRIKEEGFSYVRRYAGESYADQPVVWWSLDNPQPGEEAVSDHVALRARDFSVNELTGCWEARVSFARDGAYSLRARLIDVAGNASETVAKEFLLDATAPVCEVTFLCDQGHAEEHEGRYYRTPRAAVVRLREHNWESMSSWDLRYVTEKGKTHRIDAAAFEPVGDDWYQCVVSFERDGEFQLFCDAADVTGTRMTPYVSEPFVIDTANPVVHVSYEGESGRNERYYSTARVATIRVVEHNWGSDESYPVTIEVHDAAPGNVVSRSAWSVPDATRPDEHVCTVRFVEDGRYTLRVSGRDLAGREMLHEGTPGYEDMFVVDGEEPLVEADFCPASYTELDGVKYVRDVIEVPVFVQERNLDPASTQLTWDDACVVGDEQIAWEQRDAVGEGYLRQSKVLRFGHGRHVSPGLVASDLAGNVARVGGQSFVVDLRAPQIQGVSTTVEPTSAYEGEVGDQRGEVQFFDRATQVVFDVADEFGIEDVGLFDPDGEYELTGDVERGCAQARVAVQLAENTDSHAADAFERNIVFTVSDVAGNYRSWTLDRKGEVVAQDVVEGEGVALNGSGEPAALVQDGIAPLVSIDGIEPGIVTNQTQLARVSVIESNFSYLQVFRPQDVIVHIASRDATPDQTRREENVVASSFKGMDPVWTYERAFAEDGHYALEASVRDVANHESNHVELGEFCIDKTAPRIEVRWDHDLDEAQSVGGKHYFNTTREATVVVHEHNFRPSDYEVDAGHAGLVGAWRDEGGDTHACTVSYAKEAKDCALVVRGRDAAGNEAQAYEQRGFTIDLTPPQVQILNVVGSRGERAFAGEITPVLAFQDGADGNFDTGALGWTYRIEGTRGANAATRGDTRRFDQQEDVSGDGATVTFADFGMKSQGEDGFDVGFDDVYTVTASVRDLAGNEGVPAHAVFSVNRFGSNFFVEHAERLGSQGASQSAEVEGTYPLPDAPTIVVHEVNVSGTLGEADHSVVRDYANMPEELTQDKQGEQPSSDDAGYSLSALSEPSRYNGYAGWAEYVYTIRSGNFGKGAVDMGDGQGLYRVNVGSIDAANNANSTSRYWASDSERNAAADKSATVVFTLDELPPLIDSLDTSSPVAASDRHFVTFHVTDDINCGDDAEVLVDGEPVEVYGAGLDKPVTGGDITTGTYAFPLEPRPFLPRVVTVRVVDYNGRSDQKSMRVYVSSFVVEASVGVLLLAIGAAVCVALHRKKDAEEPEYPQVA